jgi:hypothetical protein
LPVAGHLAQMCPVPKHILRTKARCIAIVLKVPYQAIPVKLLRIGRSFGLSYDMPDIETLGKAAAFRAAEASGVLCAVTAEHARARRSRYATVSPYLRAWTHAGVVGYLRDNLEECRYLFDLPPLVGRGLQAWATRQLRKNFNMELMEAAFVRRTSSMTGVAVSIEAVRRMRLQLVSLRGSLPQVVQSSMVRSICNAWTTSGRFGGPRLLCPFGCRVRNGDRWSHFVRCTAIRRMWEGTCPSALGIFVNFSFEKAVLLSPDLSRDEAVQVALWTDVVGHCANDVRAAGTSPATVFIEGEGMMAARLRFLAVQSDGAREAICNMRTSRLSGCAASAVAG